MEEFSFTIVRELSVDLANEVGSFASLTEALAKAQVLIHGISVESGHSVSRVHFVVDNPNAALSILEQEGERVSAKDVLAVTLLERRVGQITRIARALADAEINIDTIYLTSAAEGTRPTIYISGTRATPSEIRECLEKI
jgi:hypothetical protein